MSLDQEKSTVYEELLEKVSLHLNKKTESDVSRSGFNSAVDFTIVNLASNVFIEHGIFKDKFESTNYFHKKIYGNKNKESQEDVDEINEILSIGRTEILDFEKKMKEELEKYLSGELYLNGDPKIIK